MSVLKPRYILFFIAFLSLILVGLVIWLRGQVFRAIYSKNYTYRQEQLAGLLGVPKVQLKFTWLKNPSESKGIVVHDETEEAVLLNVWVERRDEKSSIQMYLAPSYRHQLQQDPVGSRRFLNTHLIYAYLLSQYEAEELNQRFTEFCAHDCRVEFWEVIK